MEKFKRVEEVENRLEAIDAERISLLNELRDLRAKERSTNPSFALDDRTYPATVEERVALFERLFVARKDLYPRMWENAQTGRKGYFPVCETIWEEGRRLKPTEIFARFGARKFERLSSGVIEAHLRGKIVVGTYAIRPDDTCIFLAADFDGDGWQGDAGAYRDEADGQWRGARKKLTGRVDVAMIQTSSNLEDPKAFFRDYGYVIIDECHHIPAVSLEALLKECGSRFITGLTATPERKDRLERLLYQQCGPIRHFINPGEQDGLVKQVFLRTSDFVASQDDGKPLPLHLVWQRMVADGPRNEQIASDVATVIREGRVPIVLSDRKAHLEKLSELVAARLSDGEVGLVTIEGSLSTRKREAALAAFSGAVHEKRPACLFATSSLLGEGFDLPILDTLFLTMPIAFKGRLVQYAGRLHRASPGKDNVLIYDYLDELLPLACSMSRKRLPAYRSMGYVTVKDEASRLDLYA